MLKQWFTSLTTPLDESVIHPDDPDDVKLGKQLFVRLNLFIIPSGILGVVFGMVGGSSSMMMLALVSTVLISLNLMIMWRTRNFSLHFSIWVIALMGFMFIWGVTLGGFKENGSTYWAAFVPLMLVILVSDQRRTIRWFLVFSVFAVIFSVVDPYVFDPSKVPSNAVFSNTYTIISIAAIILLTINYFKREKNAALHLVGVERERADNLLLNILPKSIAEILKVEERTIADHHEAASILFADLVGFTPLSAEMEPAEMIALLNQIYSHFDTLADKYGVEKIRTIGDNYMVAAGVPESRPDHAQALAGMALDMHAYAKVLPPQHGHNINFRIGINSGPLVAGVIGSKKFHYDVWGDTVNTASRMESHGVPGRVHISAVTRELLKEEFDSEKRGLLEIKGKGEMETWFLTGRKE